MSNEADDLAIEEAPPRPLGRRIYDRVIYLLMRAGTGLASALPPRAGVAMGIATGEFVYRVLRTRRRVVEENLRWTLGRTLDRAGCDRIARGVYHHLGRTLFEYGSFQHMDRQRLEGMIDVVGFDAVTAAMAMGKGFILCAGHFGNWEMAGVPISLRGYTIHFVAKKQRNPDVDRYLADTRKQLGAGLLYVGPELRRIFRRLRAGEIIGMLVDQDAGRSGEFRDVLGRTASAQPGAGVFSQRTGAPIVPCAARRLPDGRHQVVYEPPLVPDPEADPAAEAERLNALCVQSLERHILRTPEQYYWVHRRWKTRRWGRDAIAATMAGE
jgi:Kdo2-lipid IVA lauroyltransferase/acyltransferase